MRAYVLLGSNLGPRLRKLAGGRRRLAAAGVRLLRASPIYATRALPAAGDASPQPWFLNQLLEVETSLDPRQLLLQLQRIERLEGRPAPPRRRAARTLDLDLIAYGRLRLHSPALVLPHPRWRERPFLLALLTELFPGGSAPLAGLAWTPPAASPDFHRWAGPQAE